MAVRVITPPAPLVTVPEAKLALGIDSSERDAQIEGMIMAAQADIDGPNGWLGRALGEQTLEATICDFEHMARLPYPDLISISSVTYRDMDGAETVVPEAVYQKDGNGIALAPGQTWPAARSDSVRVQYVAGMTADSLDMARVKLAINTHVKMLFDMEEPPIYEQVIRSLLGGLVVMA